MIYILIYTHLWYMPLTMELIKAFVFIERALDWQVLPGQWDNRQLERAAKTIKKREINVTVNNVFCSCGQCLGGERLQRSDEGDSGEQHRPTGQTQPHYSRDVQGAFWGHPHPHSVTQTGGTVSCCSSHAATHWLKTCHRFYTPDLLSCSMCFSC